MATHSSVLAWRIPGTGEPGGLPSLGSHRVGHDWSDLAAAAETTTGHTRTCAHANTHTHNHRASGSMIFRATSNDNPLQYSCLENPRDEEPGRLQSMGLVRVRYNWVTSLSLFTFMHWRRKWQPTPVFLPGESQGQGSLVDCRLWGCTESDMTEAT